MQIKKLLPKEVKLLLVEPKVLETVHVHIELPGKVMLPKIIFVITKRNIHEIYRNIHFRHGENPV